MAEPASKNGQLSAGRRHSAGVSAWLFIIILVMGNASLSATPLRDKGIYVAGPFGTPDISKPPNACAEAVFLAGSVEQTPFYLNELVVTGDDGQFTNNGWVGGDAFAMRLTNGGTSLSIDWDLTGTGYALTYVSVNFDNNFYHVYAADRFLKSDGAMPITGNQRDVISRVRFFGIRTVPENGATAGMFCLGLGAIGLLQRRLAGHSSQ